MSELSLMAPQPPSNEKRREKNLHRFGHGISPGRRAKDDKPTPASKVIRTGLPVLLVMLLALVGTSLGGCDSCSESIDGRTMGEHMTACHNMCLPAPVAAYRNGNCECGKIVASDAGTP